MAYVTNTLENQSIVLKTWGRGAKLGNPKIFLPLHGVKIEELGGGIWSILTFLDPFTQKEVKIKRMRTNYHAIDAADKSPRNRYGIPGFMGFTDPVKREKKKTKSTNLTDQGRLNIKHFGGAAAGATNYTRTKLREGALVPQILQVAPTKLQPASFGNIQHNELGVNADNGQPVFMQGEYVGNLHTLETKSYFGQLGGVMAHVDDIRDKIEGSLGGYIGEPISQKTLGMMQNTIVNVMQDEIFKDRINVDVTFTVPAPSPPSNFKIVSDLSLYENRD